MNNAAAKFTLDKLDDAQYFMRQANRAKTMKVYTEFRKKAFVAFGMAMHPGMDAMSPMHAWAVYDPSIEPFTFAYEMHQHSKGEARAPNESEMSVMKQQMRMFFSRTFGTFSP